MSLREVTMYTIVCDRCGVSVDEGTDYAAWADDTTSLQIAQDNGWLVTDDGSHYCDECFDWDEETDEKVPKPSPVATQEGQET